MAVPTQTPQPPSYEEKHIQRLEHEGKLFADEKTMGWAVVWTLFAFKMATITVIMIVARNTRHAGTSEHMAFIVSTTWYWFFIPIVALSGFVTWRLRLRKARNRAEEMKRSEFGLSLSSDSLTEAEKERLRRLPRLAETDR